MHKESGETVQSSRLPLGHQTAIIYEYAERTKYKATSLAEC